MNFKSKAVWLNILSTGVEIVNLLSGSVIPQGVVTIVTNSINIIIHAIKRSEKKE